MFIQTFKIIPIIQIIHIGGFGDGSGFVGDSVLLHLPALIVVVDVLVAALPLSQVPNCRLLGQFAGTSLRTYPWERG
jgi:hypothetical protein